MKPIGIASPLAILSTLVTLLAGCATTAPVAPPPIMAPKPELAGVPIVVIPKARKIIPKGSRLVITNVSGSCSDEVKDALMRRLIDNADYSILSRDNLDQIMVEADRSWGARFNSETAARLGELMGASYFIVGRVVYCGPPGTALSLNPYAANRAVRADEELTLLAALQIIDLATGQVLLSSASEGRYVPGSNSLFFTEDPLDEASESAAEEASSDQARVGQPAESSPWVKVGRVLRDRLMTQAAGDDRTLARPSQLPAGAPSQDGTQPKDKEEKGSATGRNYPIIRAAEAVADSFADKFFARPTWEVVQMWKSDKWHYGDSIRYVKLGHCNSAVQLLANSEAQDLPYMTERQVGEFLHNYGVALLCDNRPGEAMGKLRAAYRINYDEATLKMVALAGKIEEWDLDVEVTQEPVLQEMADRGLAVPLAVSGRREQAVQVSAPR